jgi:hypothetical protein
VLPLSIIVSPFFPPINTIKEKVATKDIPWMHDWKLGVVAEVGSIKEKILPSIVRHGFLPPLLVPLPTSCQDLLPWHVLLYWIYN